jgi:plastocyanin
MTSTTLPAKLVSRRPTPVLARWTVGSLIAITVLLTYMQIFLFRSFEPPVALIFGVPALIFAVLIVTIRRPWVPLLGTLYGALFLGANAPYLGYDLGHPGNFTNFAFSIVLVVPAAIGMAAGIGAAAQSYRARATNGGEARPIGSPPWFRFGLTVLVALSLGAVGVAAIAPAGASAGVSPEVLAGLPALTVAQLRFGPAELRARAGETVALRLENKDSASHAFDIDELGIHVAMPAGQPALALFKAAAPGTYTYYCSVPGHRDAGMVGTLVVEP